MDSGPLRSLERFRWPAIRACCISSRRRAPCFGKQHQAPSPTGCLAASQSGSFTDGSYAFRMEGVDAGGATGQAEVFLGQFTSLTPAMPAGSAPVLNGSLDLNDFGATQTGLPITTGTHTASTGPRSTATFPIGKSSDDHPKSGPVYGQSDALLRSGRGGHCLARDWRDQQSILGFGLAT